MKTIDVLLEEKDVVLDELAQRSGLPLERVASIAEGRWTPNPREREKIAAALGVQITDVSWGHTMNPRNVRYHRFGLKDDFALNESQRRTGTERNSAEKQ